MTVSSSVHQVATKDPLCEIQPRVGQGEEARGKGSRSVQQGWGRKSTPRMAGRQRAHSGRGEERLDKQPDLSQGPGPEAMAARSQDPPLRLSSDGKACLGGEGQQFTRNS